MMLTLLIVDDHPYQANSIEHVVTEAKLPFISSIYKAYSAKKALECFNEHKVDIVITDIRMPEISGIELIGKLRQASRKVKCVLLSGYAEFEYAQKALELQTSKYLMKPVVEADLIGTLEMLRDEIAEERQNMQQHDKAVHVMRKNMPIMKNNLVLDLILGRSVTRRELEQRMESMELPFVYGDEALFFAVQLEDDLSGYNENDKSLICYAVGNIAEELFRDSFFMLHATVSNRQLVFVLKPQERKREHAPDRLERRAKELQRSVYRYLKHMISVAIVSSTVLFPSGLQEAYQKSMLLFRNREDKVAGLFATITDLPIPKLTGSIHSLYKTPTFASFMETARWDEAKARLSEIFLELESKWSDSTEYAQEVFFVIAGTYQFVSHKQGKQLIDVIGPLYKQMLEKHESWDLGTFRAWAFQSLDSIIADQMASNMNRSQSLSSRIQQYVERNLDQDLSLQMISEELRFHPAYLSNAFKVETGQTLSDYLLKQRMEHAAELLKQTDGKIYEIAEKAGYQTTHYFIKQFKKIFGVTPQQYRNRDIGRN